MDRLSDSLIFELFVYIPLSDILKSLQFTSKRFNLIVQDENFLRRSIAEELNTIKTVNISKQECLQLIQHKLLHPKSNDIKFWGFATSGGIDEENPKFWVSNLFKRTERCYSTRSYKDDINCAAVLSSTQPKMQIRQVAKRDIENILRNILQRNGVPMSLVRRLKLVRSLRDFVLNFNLDDLLRTEENSSEIKKAIQDRLKQLEHKIIPYKIRRHYSDPYILEDSLNHTLVNNSKRIACIREVDVSRHGNFTCPVAALMVFISDEYVDVASSEFELFNNLRTKPDVTSLCNAQKFKYIIRNTKLTNCRVVEFLPARSNLKPIFWLGYKNKTLERSTRVTLSSWFSGVYVYIKLIYSHDRKDEEGWHHEDTNIDCRFVMLRGFELDLISPP